MQYALVLAGALLAAAHPHQNEAHGRLHRMHNRDVVVTDVEIDTVTVTDYVTAGEAQATPAAASSGDWAAAGSSVAAVSSVAPVYSSPSSSAAPVVKVAPSSAPVYSAPASSAAPAPSSYSSAPSSAASSAASSASSSAPAASGLSVGNLTPKGKKAGLSGYPGVTGKSSFASLAPYISWYSDYTANTPDSNGVMGIGMLWGASGSPCGEFERLATFNEMATNNTTPSIMFGFYEPDCTCTMSSDMSTTDAATQWNSLIAPMKAKGTVLGSPSMCKQKDEDFLTPFKSGITTDWDVTSIHVNKNNLQGAKDDVEYYVNKYNKPVWVSEFACVDDANGFTACTDQGQIDQFINDVVSYFESNSNVVAYGPSNGDGLGTVWPLTDASTGALTPSGQTYLNAIKNL
ncbi:hypothetical protein LTR78_003165 [Recurvomyces mirabilis]|uniref:Asl1-like glycosyl hydrolase catalytic domain-containing protein n=1 Tax=Recurvomyces mirabilis TaxID=574656 RepID=A0AAE0WSS9_9PEZI|nr:hypothetical protein LTR78_003165 [Recurvomyces mirabilis]KAK5157014.1 hypothetical protein LTS14_004531 [Recurvomyces mirabilis]